MKEPVSGKFLKQLLEETKDDPIINMDIESPILRKAAMMIDRERQRKIDRALVDALIKPVKKEL